VLVRLKGSLLSWGWGCLVVLASPAAMAQVAVSAPATPLHPPQALRAVAQAWVDSVLSDPNNFGVGRPVDADGLRIQTQVGEPDARLRLAACAQVEPYLPPNTRLWGKSRVGLRCLQGPVRWNIVLPLTVQAFGPAWVLRDAVLPGTPLQTEHAMQAEVDWAQQNGAVLTEPEQWLGRVAARPLSAGHTLRSNDLRAAQAFAAGTQVRVLVQGPGFSVASSGQALGAGVLGQTVRVRMDNGRVLSAEVLDAQTVRMSL
jgi:flagella basal body P-ring formation protein FlgA